MILSQLRHTTFGPQQGLMPFDARGTHPPPSEMHARRVPLAGEPPVVPCVAEFESVEPIAVIKNRRALPPRARPWPASAFAHPATFAPDTA